jgi:hypothetical protein
MYLYVGDIDLASFDAFEIVPTVWYFLFYFGIIPASVVFLFDFEIIPTV